MMIARSKNFRPVAPGIQPRSATATHMAHSKNFREAICLALGVLLLLTGCARSGAPVLGISAGWDRGRVDVSDAYAISVRAAGGVPVVLPPVLTASEASEVLSRVDALVLTGGEDVDPSRYGEDIWNETVEVNYRRDTSDFLLARAALTAGLPILGICRGEQLLNVVLGGTLYQDLPTCIGKSAFIRGSAPNVPCGSQATDIACVAGSVPPSAGHAEACHEPICHRQSEPDGVGTHMIYLSADSRLREMLGADSLMVNSFHHQAVKDPAPGIRVAARAADGVIEAWEWESPSRSTLVCVQFHPELLYARGGDTTVLPIFEDLVARAR